MTYARNPIKIFGLNNAKYAKTLVSITFIFTKDDIGTPIKYTLYHNMTDSCITI